MRSTKAELLYQATSLLISARIARIIKRKGLTHQQVADKVGVGVSEVTRWTKGGLNFTLKTISRIEAALGESVINVPINVKRPKK